MKSDPNSHLDTFYQHIAHMISASPFPVTMAHVIL